jgi:hypothetical protein
MASTGPSMVERLRILSGGHFSLSNALGLFATTAQVAAVGFATFPTLLGSALGWTPIISALLALAGAGARGVGERHRATGDEMLRRVEASDGAGTPLQPRELADWEYTASWLVRRLAREPNLGSYFASAEPPSPRRTVLNTYESAWWSCRLASNIADYSYLAIGVIVILGVLVLRAAVPETGLHVGASTINAASAAILFLLTDAPLRRALGLRAFSAKSSRIVDKAEELLSAESISESAAADLQTQYQLARAAAPGISSLAWSMRSRELNNLWKTIAASVDRNAVE